MSGCIAVINAGSSSVKFALYEASRRGQRAVPRPGRRNWRRAAPDDPRTPMARSSPSGNWPADGFNHDAATREILTSGATLIAGTPVIGIGHRVVHGGMRLRCTGPPGSRCAGVAVGADTTGAVAPAAQPGTDSHHPGCGAAHPTGRLLRHSVPSWPAAGRAVFCTAARSHDAGIRRYGFHGLSYEYLVSQLRATRPRHARSRASSSRIWATAPACAPSGMAGASRARWDSPRSMV